MNESIINPIDVLQDQNSDLKKLVNILKDENKLALMNAIALRQTLALGHYDFLLSAKSDTESLIEELEHE